MARNCWNTAAERPQVDGAGVHESVAAVVDAEPILGADVDPSGRRASKKGFLAITMLRYLELLDWTGRQVHRDKAGAIPERLAPILSRIGLDAQAWCDLVKKFGRTFKRAAGTAESMADEAVPGIRWSAAPSVQPSVSLCRLKKTKGARCAEAGT